MRKVEIIDAIVDNTDLNRTKAKEAVECVFNAMGEALINGESIYIRGFATIKARTSKPKTARNISRNTSMLVPARKDAKLIICKRLKTLMNK